MTDDNGQPNKSQIQRRAEELLNDRREVVPGISRGQATRYAVGLLLYTLAVCGVTFLVSSQLRGTRQTQAAQQTQIAQIVEQTATATAAFPITQTQQSIAASETAAAQITPTPTPRQGAFAVANQPTATATPSPTPQEIIFLPTPPPDLPGTIIGWGGRNPLRQDFSGLRYYNPGAVDGFTNQPIEFTSDVTASNNVQRIVYSGFSVRTGDTGIYVQRGDNFDDESELLVVRFQRTGFVEPRDGHISSDGRYIVFVAERTATGSTDVYRYDFSLQRLEQLTNSLDGTEYTDPAIAADGSQVVVVRESDAGTDLLLIELPVEPPLPENVTPTPSPVPAEISLTDLVAPLYQTLTLTDLTTNGDESIEGMPVFSPDSVQIAYTAHTSGSPESRDIFLQPLAAGAGSIVVAGNPDADEIHPAFSPDSAYIAYASNQFGMYNILIQQISTSDTFQITTAESAPNFPGSWIPATP